MFKKSGLSKIFLLLSVAVSLTALLAGMGYAQQPFVNLQGKAINQIGIVVKDAEKTAKKYQEVFGIAPCRMGEFRPYDIIMHDQSAPGEAVVKYAMCSLGDITIELLQPVSGPSTWMEFLNKEGEGIHHVSFGMLTDADAVLEGFKKAGYGIEMRGTMVGGSSTFWYMATRDKLGTIFEFVKRNVPAAAPAAPGPGFVAPTFPAPGLIDMKDKRVVQIGLIVKDHEASAKSYFELFGAKPWRLLNFQASNIILHDQPQQGGALAKAAIVNEMAGRQIELINPISGPSTWMEFRNQHGPGAHHFSFSTVDTSDSMLMALQGAGYGVEMRAILGGLPPLGPTGEYSFCYMDTQKDLATITEWVKRRLWVPPSTTQYGVYPPQ